jgi:hypothetical protein
LKCEKCKYFAVPLSDDEKKNAHCPGANPFGDPNKKICVLQGKEGFEVDPDNCKYFFSIHLRFR